MFFIAIFLTILEGLIAVSAIPSKILQGLSDLVQHKMEESPSSMSDLGNTVAGVGGFVFVVVSFVGCAAYFDSRPSSTEIRLKALEAENAQLKALPARQAPQAVAAAVSPTPIPTPGPIEIYQDAQTAVNETKAELAELETELKEAKAKPAEAERELSEIQDEIKETQATLKEQEKDLKAAQKAISAK